jgi:hypothetical protein
MKKNSIPSEQRIGQKFGRLLIVGISRVENESNRKVTYALCACDCSNMTKKLMHSLTRGTTRSCGCYNLECLTKNKSTHGLSKSRTYRIWRHMRNRCHLKTHPRYDEWGGRGIKVCDEWRYSFENFYRDMGEATGKLSIDRIDNNKGYYKENCRWATIEQQAQNKIKKYKYWGISDRGNYLIVRFALNKKNYSWKVFMSMDEACQFRDLKYQEIFEKSQK